MQVCCDRPQSDSGAACGRKHLAVGADRKRARPDRVIPRRSRQRRPTGLGEQLQSVHIGPGDHLVIDGREGHIGRKAGCHTPQQVEALRIPLNDAEVPGRDEPVSITEDDHVLGEPAGHGAAGIQRQACGSAGDAPLLNPVLPSCDQGLPVRLECDRAGLDGQRFADALAGVHREHRHRAASADPSLGRSCEQGSVGTERDVPGIRAVQSRSVRIPGRHIPQPQIGFRSRTLGRELSFIVGASGSRRGEDSSVRTERNRIRVESRTGGRPCARSRCSRC